MDLGWLVINTVCMCVCVSGSAGRPALRADGCAGGEGSGGERGPRTASAASRHAAQTSSQSRSDGGLRLHQRQDGGRFLLFYMYLFEQKQGFIGTCFML